MATLAAAHLKFQKKLPVQAPNTYGQPRFGKLDFARCSCIALPGRVVRFANDQDIVPQVPPPGLLLKYWQSKREGRFDPAGELSLDISVWPKAMAALRGSRQGPGKLQWEALPLHRMDRYIELVRRPIARKAALAAGF